MVTCKFLNTKAYQKYSHKNKATKLGRVAYACNSSTQEAREEDHKLQASLGDIVRLCQKKVILNKVTKDMLQLVYIKFQHRKNIKLMQRLQLFFSMAKTTL